MDDRKWFGKKDCFILLAVFAAALIPRLLIALQMNPFFYVKDELSTISAFSLWYPADWSDVLTNMTGYYGGGFSIFYAPLFFLLKNSLLIYKAMMVIMSVLQALIVIPAYCIIKKHFRIDDGRIAGLLSLCASYAVTRRSTNVTNESVLYLLTWCIFWVLLELVQNAEEKKKKIIYSVVLAVLIAYALTVHERALVLLGMLAVAFVFWIIVYRKLFLSVPAFAITYAAGYLLARIFKKAILTHNFSALLREVTNSSIGGNLSNFVLLKNPGNWKAFIFSTAGSLTTASVVTAGLFITGGLICLYILFHHIFRASSVRAEESETAVIDQKFAIGFLFFYAGIAAIILSQSVRWLPSFEAALENGWHLNNYNLKIVTYIRYYGNCIGPAVTLTVLFLYIRKKASFKFALLSALFTLLLAGFWLKYLYPYMSHSNAAKEAWLPFGGMSLFNDTYGYLMYVIGAVVLIAMAAIIFLLVKSRRFEILLIVLAGFLIYQYVFTANDWDIKKVKQNQKLCDTYTACLDLGITDCFDEIYTSRSAATRYQFLFYDSKVHPYLPDYETEEGIMIVSSTDDAANASGYGWKLLDLQNQSTHYVMAKGQELLEKLSARGVAYQEEIVFEKILEADQFKVLNLEKQTVETLGFELTAGTYRITVDGDVIVQVMDEYQNILSTVQGYDREEKPEQESETGTFSLESRQKISVSLLLADDAVVLDESMTAEELADELVPFLNEVRITQTATEYVFGLYYREELDTIVETIKKDSRFDTLYYYTNQDSSAYNLYYFNSKLGPINVSTVDEIRLKQNREEAYVVAKVDSDYMNLADSYDVMLTTDHYVLMAKAKDDRDGYMDIDLLKQQNGKNSLLSAGIYSIRFSEIGDDHLRDDLILEYRMTSKEKGITYAQGYVSAKTGYLSTIWLSEPAQSWRIDLLSGEEFVPCKIEIAKPASALDKRYDNEVFGLFRLADEAGYTGVVKVFTDLGDDSAETLESLIDLVNGENHYQMSAAVRDYSELNPYDPEGSGIDPGTDWIIIPKTPENVYPLIPEYIVVKTWNDMVLLAPNTEKNRTAFREKNISTISENEKMSVEFYREKDEMPGRVIVPRGTYKVYISLSDQIADKSAVSVFRGTDRTVISSQSITEGTKEAVLTIRAVETLPRLVVGPAPTQEGILSANIEQKELDKYQITAVEKISDDLIFDLTECSVKGQESVDPDGIKGRQTLQIRTPEFRMVRQSWYRVRIIVEGEPVSANLSCVNTGFLNEIVEVHTSKNNISRLEDGKYEIFMRINPTETRQHNVLDCNLNFAGEYRILELRIDNENNK